jgi:hypothetical protein
VERKDYDSESTIQRHEILTRPKSVNITSDESKESPKYKDFGLFRSLKKPNADPKFRTINPITKRPISKSDQNPSEPIETIQAPA